MANSKRIFSGGEAALAYALCAERLFNNDPGFIDNNRAVIPIFVSLLFQSLEISIKHACIKSKLFTMDEARDRQRGSGHGIEELASLASERLGGEPADLVMAMTCCNSRDVRSEQIIKEMIYRDKFKKTRKCYCSRSLGYAEVSNGDFAILALDQFTEWIESVKQTALNLDKTIKMLEGWKASPSKSKHFAIWFRTSP